MSRKKAPSRLLTDAVREVRNTRSRFLSLLVLSALAVCFLAGLRATAPDMKETGDLYFDQQRLMDLRVVSTLGLTEEDVELLARQEGVEEAEGAYTIDAAVPLKDQEMIVKVHSFAEEGSNRPRLVEGRLPRKAGECLVEPLFLEKSGLSIGDTIRLDTGTGDLRTPWPGGNSPSWERRIPLCISPWSGVLPLWGRGRSQPLFCCRRRPFPWTTTPTPTFRRRGRRSCCVTVRTTPSW